MTGGRLVVFPHCPYDDVASPSLGPIDIRSIRSMTKIDIIITQKNSRSQSVTHEYHSLESRNPMFGDERGTTSKKSTHRAAREIGIPESRWTTQRRVRSFVRNHAEITTRGLRRGFTRIDDDSDDAHS